METTLPAVGLGRCLTADASRWASSMWVVASQLMPPEMSGPRERERKKDRDLSDGGIRTAVPCRGGMTL